MTSTAVTTTNPQGLIAAMTLNSWSQFSREYGSATSMIQAIPFGTYVEVSDKKFQGDSLIILRRTDFEKVLKSSRASSQIRKILFTIERTTHTYQGSGDPMPVIEAVREAASLGVELAGTTPIFATAQEYLAHPMAKADAASEDEDLELPKTVSELRHGVKKH
jgi:hypothetical protein